MNELLIYGGRKKERELAERVVGWCVKKLMPRMKTLEITVSFEKIEAYGYCMEEDSNREFTVTIRKGLPIAELIGTIVHEMIHVKQYARKELRNVNGKTMWKTKDYTNVNYMDSPWEKEAYKLESSLTAKCFFDLNFFV